MVSRSTLPNPATPPPIIKVLTSSRLETEASAKPIFFPKFLITSFANGSPNSAAMLITLGVNALKSSLINSAIFES